MLNIEQIIDSIFASDTWKALNDQNVNSINNDNWPGIYLLALMKII
jgi:hypothetical protein